MIITQNNVNRFFKYTKENINGCIEWTASTVRNGYGRFSYKNKGIGAHRFAWMLKYGEIPENLCVCHSCDNPKCVNWKHLWLGTFKHNALDRDLKNRHNRRKKKLNNIQENDIAIAFYTSDTTQKELAQKYGVTRELINKTIRVPKFRDKYIKKTIKRYNKIIPKQTKEISLRIKNGETCSSLAKEFGVTPEAIRWHADIKKSRNKHNKLQRIRRAKSRL